MLTKKETYGMLFWFKFFRRGGKKTIEEISAKTGISARQIEAWESRFELLPSIPEEKFPTEKVLRRLFEAIDPGAFDYALGEVKQMEKEIAGMSALEILDAVEVKLAAAFGFKIVAPEEHRN